MEFRKKFIPGSSASRNGIRRRSGQAIISSSLENNHATSAIEYSPSSREPPHPKQTPSASVGDPHSSKCTSDGFSPGCLAVPVLPPEDMESSTVMLVRSGSDDSGERKLPFARLSDASNDSAGLQVERPLPSLPEEEPFDIRHQLDHSGGEELFSHIPLTPRPEASRFLSQGSRTSKISQRPRFSLFPRLPTPDFALSGHSVLKRVLTPLGSPWRRVPSSASVSFSFSSDPTSVEATDTSKSFHIPLDATQVEQLVQRFFRTDSESFESTNRPVKPSNIVCDDEIFPALMAATSSRFTQKFPSLASVPSFHGSSSRINLLHGMIASENGTDLGAEGIGMWTCYKWCLMFSVLTVFGHAVVGFLYSILIWFGTHSHAEVIMIADNDILIFVTLASALLLLTGLVGLSGTLLNSRPILAFYALLLWPSFISVLVIGYTSYKREAFSLDKKLNMAWSQWYDDLGRLLIQESLHCCGFYSPLHEATFSKNCYPRTPLPGCKGKLYRFEKEILRFCWRLAFALVPLHVINITISLLCSNHVDRRFGKGLMPRAYRLNINDVRANADMILAQFAENKLPSMPSRSLSHVTDREDRPRTSRM